MGQGKQTREFLGFIRMMVRVITLLYYDSDIMIAIIDTNTSRN